ncbi:MAG: hypothetical protein WAV51_02410 [Microgenomates group bacterium]
MTYSRLRKFEEKRQERKIFGSLIGIIAIFLFLIIFGLKILTGFSILVDNIRGSSKKTTTAAEGQQLILPPELNPLPVATNSASLVITGKGTAGLTAVLNINELDTKDVKVGEDGSFTFTSVPLTEGQNSFSATLTDDKKNISAASDIMTVTYKKSKPTLDITAPSDGTKITGEQNTVTVTGKTEDTNTVTVNGRMAVMKNDGSFSLDFSLGEGDTTLAIIATDLAGNQTKVERKVSYSK